MSAIIKSMYKQDCQNYIFLGCFIQLSLLNIASYRLEQERQQFKFMENMEDGGVEVRKVSHWFPWLGFIKDETAGNWFSFAN